MAPGTQFELKIYPDLETVMVVMSNYNTIGGPEMASSAQLACRLRVRSRRHSHNRLEIAAEVGLVAVAQIHGQR